MTTWEWSQNETFIKGSVIQGVMGNGQTQDLEARIADAPIKLPRNPFIDELLGFGADEMMGAGVAVVGVLATELLLDTIGVDSETAKAGIMTVAAPVIEKVGFYFRHIWDARKIYKTTVPEDRKKLLHYVGRAIKGGNQTLFWDLVGHDPAYMGLLFTALYLNPGADAVTTGALTAGSFLAGLAWATGLQVGAKELMHHNNIRKLKKSGFETENYHEARFLLDGSNDPQEVIRAMQNKFNLREPQSGDYLDRYFDHKLVGYSGRKPKLRLRKRKHPERGWVQTAQIVYTKPRELKTNGLEQFRYFLSRKEKVYAHLEGDMPEELKDVSDAKVRKALMAAQDGDKYRDIHFTRTVTHGDELLISTDFVHGIPKRDFYVVEVKTFKDKRLLQTAMRYLMTHYIQVYLTTVGKSDLAVVNK